MHRSSSPAAERESLASPRHKAVGIIPARLHSTRLPEKALQDLGGAPLIVRVMERVRQAAAIRKVWVATDSPRIAEAVRSAGGDVIMTRAELPSGLDRVAEAAREVGDEIIVNIQGDEPFVSPAGLAHLVSLFEDPNARIATLAAPFPPASDPSDPNRVKVVLDRAGRALYFSRSPIPHGAGGDLPALLHVGVYAYRRETLLDLARFGPCLLERSEGLEQLRALWHGIPIHVAVGSYGSLGIDTPEDLDRARLQYGTRRETR